MPEPSAAGTAEGTQPPAAAPTAPTQQPAVAPAPAPEDDEGKTLQVKHGDFKKIKAEARDRGRAEALAELGFTSMDEAAQAVAAFRKPAAAPAAPPPEPERRTMAAAKNPKNGQSPQDSRAAREAAKAEDERRRSRQAWKNAERAKRQAQVERDAAQGRVDLIKEMFSAGVKDVDYVEALMRRELHGKPVEEIAKFDRKAFYEKVKAAQPYLFVQPPAPVEPAKPAAAPAPVPPVEVPATTGTNGSPKPGDATAAPAPPPAGQATKEQAVTQQFDAMKASKDDVAARLRKLGLDPHAIS